MIATRDYRRNGTLYRTVNGERKKFGIRMGVHFRISAEMIDDPILDKYFDQVSNRHIKKLHEESGLSYVLSRTEIGEEMDDYILNTKIVYMYFTTDKL